MNIIKLIKQHYHNGRIIGLMDQIQYLRRDITTRQKRHDDKIKEIEADIRDLDQLKLNAGASVDSVKSIRRSHLCEEIVRAKTGHCTWLLQREAFSAGIVSKLTMHEAALEKL